MKHSFTKKVLPIFTAVLISTSLFAGCSGNNAHQDSASASAQGTEQAAPASGNSSQPSSQEPSASQPAESAAALLSFSLFSFGQTLPTWVDEKDDVVGQYIKDKFNITIGDVTNLSGMTFKEKMNLFVASDTMPDVVTVYGDIATCPSTGQFAELGDLVKANCPNFMTMVPEQYWNDMLYDGKLYSIGGPAPNPLDYPDDPYAIPSITWDGIYTSESTLKQCGYSFTPMSEINKQINASGKKPSPDLYKITPEIKTPDDFYNFLKKINEVIPKVNGQDVIPFSIPLWLEPHFGGSFGLSGWWMYNADAKTLSSFLTNDNSKAYWQFMNKLYNEGLLDKDFAIQKVEQLNDKILQGRVKSFMWSSTWPTNSDVQTALKKADPNDCLRVIPLPKQPGSNFLGIDHQGRTTGNLFYINKNFSDIPRLLQYFDWTMSKEASELAQWGPESLGLWEMKDGKRVWKDEALHTALDKNNADYLKSNYYNYGLGGGSGGASVPTSKYLCNLTAPMMDLAKYQPYSWKTSYPFKVADDDYLTQNGVVTWNGVDTKGYLTPGGGDASNKICDFIYGEFEQSFSAKLFAAKTPDEFDKNWNETVDYFNKQIDYPAGLAEMQSIMKSRGFEITGN